MRATNTYLYRRNSRLVSLETLLSFLEIRKAIITLELEYLHQAAADCEAHLRQLQEDAHYTPVGVYRLICAAHEVHLTYSSAQGCIPAVMQGVAGTIVVCGEALTSFGTPHGAERRVARACIDHIRDIESMLEELEDLRLELWAYVIDIYAQWL